MFPHRPQRRLPEHEGHYYEVRLMEGEYLAVLKLLRAQLKTAQWKSIAERFELARLMELPWTFDHQWEFAELWAEVGYDVVAQIEDGFYATKPPEAHVQREVDALDEGKGAD